MLLLRTSPIQNYLAQKTASYISHELNTVVEIKGFRLSWFLDVNLSNIKILDKKKQVLLSAEKIRLNIENISLKHRTLTIKEILLKNADVNLITSKSDSASNLQFVLDYFSSPTVDTTHSAPWEIKCKNVDLRDSHFAYRDEKYIHPVKGINFSDLDFANLNMQLRDLKIKGDSILTDIVHFSVKEKSGFKLNDFTAQAMLCPRSIVAKDLIIATDYSRLSIDLKLDYRNWDAYSYFIDSVRIKARVLPSQLDMRDLTLFEPGIEGMKDVFNFSGEIQGEVSSFSAQNWQMTYGESTVMKGDFKINGLPDIEETFVHLNLHEFKTKISDAESFTIPYSEGKNTIKLPMQLARLGKIEVKGKFTGFYNDFVSKATFITDVGNLITDIKLVNDRQLQSIGYNGRIIADQLDVGNIFEVKKLGKLSLDVSVTGKNFTFAKADLSVKGEVTDVFYDGNTIGLINVDGKLHDKKFFGGVYINDNLIGLDFNGLVDLSNELPYFDCKANLAHANLAKLKILPNDSITEIATQATFSFSGNNLDNMLGNLKFENSRLVKGNQSLKMQNFLLETSATNDRNKHMTLRSDFVDADFSGNYTFDDLTEYLTLVFTDFLPSLADFSKPPERLKKGSFSYTINLYNTAPVTAMFAPWISINPHTTITGAFAPETGSVSIDGKSPNIDVKGISLHDWKLSGKSEGKKLILHMECSAMDMSGKAERDTTQKSIEQVKLLAIAKNDSVAFHMSWDDFESPDRYKGDISGNISFVQYPRITVSFDNTEIMVNDSIWRVLPDNLIVLDSTNIAMKNIGFTHGNQHIYINGTASADPVDQLVIDFNNFDISNTDVLTNSIDIDMDGYLSGEVMVSDLFAVPKLRADLNVQKFGFNHEYLGNADLKTTWDNDKSMLSVDVRVVYIGNAGTHYPIKALGNIYLERKKDNFDINVEVDNLNIHTLEPFLSSVFSRMRGLASGEMTLTGDFADPVLTGKIKLMRSEMLINYLRTSYSFTGDLNFAKDLMWFKNIQLNDSTGKSGIASGNIRHKAFGDMDFDISVKADNLAVLNTPYNADEMYYGKARVTGTMSLKGPVDNLLLTSKVTSQKGTSIFIPISFAKNISDNTFIQYRVKDTSAQWNDASVPDESSILNLQLALDVTRDAEINIILPYQMGNIQARGDGLINLGIDTRGDYTMHGQYTMDRGNFLFNFQNILKRNFQIQKGGIIRFNGSPYDADINLEAVYRIKTTLGGLPNIDPQYSSTHVPVDCTIKLSNSLYNPDIRFSIALPDASEELKRMVFSAIDTSNSIAMNQQMISLLVLNSFASTNGIALSTAGAGFSSYELIGSQVSNWLSQISKDFDIGVNYRPGDQISPKELELALSTQLFNNRVSIESNLGKNTYNNSMQTSRWVGDFLVEVKLTEDGRFKVKAFNRTNSALDLYSGQAPYTQGVGIMYRKDFDGLNDLFSRNRALRLLQSKPAAKTK